MPDTPISLGTTLEITLVSSNPWPLSVTANPKKAVSFRESAIRTIRIAVFGNVVGGLLANPKDDDFQVFQYVTFLDRSLPCLAEN